MKIKEKFILLLKEWQKLQKSDPSQYKKINNIYDKLDEINKIIEKNNFPVIIFYNSILKNEYLLYPELSGFIRKYEPEIIKKLYNVLYNNGKEEYLLPLELWNRDQKEIKEKYKEEIERYERWKKENPEEHKKIIEEFYKILDNLEEKLNNKEKAL